MSVEYVVIRGCGPSPTVRQETAPCTGAEVCYSDAGDYEEAESRCGSYAAGGVPEGPSLLTPE